MVPAARPGAEPTGPHLQAAPGAVLRHDADVGGVDACADEPGQVVELDVSHLESKQSATVRRERWWSPEPNDRTAATNAQRCASACYFDKMFPFLFKNVIKLRSSVLIRLRDSAAALEN